MKNINPYKFAGIIGLSAFVPVFWINLVINLFSTAFVRGLIAFLFFFILGLALSFFVVHFEINGENKQEKGSIDLTSNEEEDQDFLNEVYQKSVQDSFQPLEFQKVEIKEKDQIQEFIKGVRTFTQNE